MAKTKTFRRRNHRRILVGAIIVLIVAALVALAVWSVMTLFDAPPSSGDTDTTTPNGESTTTSAPTTTMPTTPPTYPDLSGEAVAGLDTSVTGNYVLLYDATHDKVLYTRGAAEICNPASITKIMTAIVAAKYATDEPFTVGDEVYLCDPQASSAYLRLGMKLSLPQMLDALLLPSGSDAAYCLAVNTVRRLYPDEELSNFEAATRFCDLMNQTAAELGTTDTRFINPDGMYHTHHKTTAEDLLKILQAAWEMDVVREALSLPRVSFTTEDGKDLSFTNTNRLLNQNTSYYYPHALGGKTGFTDEAGYCLASVAEKDGVTLFSLVLGCAEENARFTDSIALFNAGFALAASV